MDWRMKWICLITVTLFTKTRQNDTVNTISETENTNEEDLLIRRVNEFGLKIIQDMAERSSGKNVVISPTSLSGLLAMTLLGTIGDTYDEISKSIGFSTDILANQKHHKQFGERLQNLNSVDESTRTESTNGIFVDKTAHLREMYRTYTSKNYRGAVTNVDFKDPNTTEFINSWVREHTNEKIKNFFPTTLPMDSQLVLLSTLYFKGQWERPFVPEFTRNMTFEKEDNSEVEAEQMLNYGKFKYANCRDIPCKFVAIPYKGGTSVLYAIKPFDRRRMTLVDMLKKINVEMLEELIDKAKNLTTIIRFPKMKLTHKYNLKQTLQNLGIKKIFTNSANFGLMIDDFEGMNKTDEDVLVKISEELEPSTKDVLKERLSNIPNPGIHIDTVFHEVEMNINEYGTEASAASSGVLVRSTQIFYADSPYFFFIRNEKTKLITFSAAIFDPTESTMSSIMSELQNDEATEPVWT